MSDPRTYVVARNNTRTRDYEEYALAYPGMSDVRWVTDPRKATYWNEEMADGFMVSCEVSEDAENPRYCYHLVETDAFDPRDHCIERPWSPTK